MLNLDIDRDDARMPILSEHRWGPFDFWFEETAPLYDIAPIASNGNTGRFDIRSMTSTAGVVLDAKYDAQSLRLMKRHSSLALDLVFVQRFHRGGVVGRSGERAFAHRPGDIAIIDYAHQFEGVHQASHLQGVYLIKESLGLAQEEQLPTLHFPAGSLAARLLGAELDRLCTPFHDGKPQLRASDFRRFLSCVKLSIAGAPVEGDVRTQARGALRDLICDYIERNLLSPDLSTTSILREFGVSRATLYRMFESENGVRCYISNRRLFGAVFDISSQQMRRGLIHETAERWGFSSDANFSRSVRRAFGTSPGDLCSNPFDAHNPTAATLWNPQVVQRFLNIGRIEQIAA